MTRSRLPALLVSAVLLASIAHAAPGAPAAAPAPSAAPAASAAPPAAPAASAAAPTAPALPSAPAPPSAAAPKRPAAGRRARPAASAAAPAGVAPGPALSASLVAAPAPDASASAAGSSSADAVAPPAASDGPAAASSAAPPASPPAPRAASAPARSTGSAAEDKKEAPDLVWPFPPLGLFVGVSLRVSRNSNSGYDPFSDTDYRAYGGLQIGKQILALPRTPFSFWAVGGWEAGGGTQKTRGQDATLTEHRLMLGIEGRGAIGRWLHAYVRASGAVTDLRATVAGAVDYDRSSWVWGGEAVAGLALTSVDGGGMTAIPRLSFALEGGRFFSGAGSMQLHAHVDESEQSRWGDLRLPSLDPSGWQGRLLLRLEM